MKFNIPIIAKNISYIAIITIPNLNSLRAIAGVTINDRGVSSGGTVSSGGSSGGTENRSSQNGLSINGDADYNAIDFSKFDLSSIYGDDSSHKNGIFGFGVETSPKDWGQFANANGNIMEGQKSWVSNDYSIGNISFFKTGTDSSRGTQALGINSFAAVQGAQANGYAATAIGQQATASGAASNAYGLLSSATGPGSIALGTNALASALDTIAVGTSASAAQDETISIGAQTSTQQKGDIALGTHSQTSKIQNITGISLGGRQYSFSGSNPYAALSVGNRQIQKVAAGSVNSSSTDAVNGSQLNAIAEYTRDGLSDNKIESDQNFAQQSELISNNKNNADQQFQQQKEQIVSNKNSADQQFNQQGQLITANSTAIDNLNNGKTGIIQQQAAGKGLTVGKDTDGSDISFADKSGNTRTLSSVSEGKLSSDSHDAVNGSQLYAEQTQRQQDKVDADKQFSDQSNQISTNKTNADQQFQQQKEQIVSNKNSADQQFNQQGQLITANSTAIDDVNSGKTGMVQQQAAGKGLTVGKDNDGSDISFADKSGNTRTLSSVSAGKLSSDSHDAVNGSQLYAEQTQRQQDKVDADQQFSDQSNQISTNKTNADQQFQQQKEQIVSNKNSADQQFNQQGQLITANSTAIDNVNSGKTGMVQQQAAGKGLTVGKDTDGSDISFADKSGNTRTLSSVSAGKLSSDSHDAVNGSQLYAEQTQRQQDNSDINKRLNTQDNQITDNKTDVDQQFNQQGQLITANSTAIDNLNNGKTGIIQQQAAGKGLTVGKDTDGSDISFADKSGNTRTLSSVSAGKLSSDSHDAVNGSQLYAEQAQRQQDKANTDQQFNQQGQLITANSTAIDNVNSGKTGMIQQQAAGKGLTVGKDTDGSDISFADKSGNTRTLSSVSAGKLSSDSHDAVNGSQLYAEQTQRQQDKVDADKQFSDQSNQISTNKTNADQQFQQQKEQIVSNKNSADQQFNQQGQLITANSTAIDNVNSGKTGMVQQQAAGKGLTVGKDTDGSDISFADKSGNTRTLSSVSAGKLSSNSHDAVNGSQLYAEQTQRQQDKVDADKQFSDQSNQISMNKTDADNKFNEQSNKISTNKAETDQQFVEQNKLITKNQETVDQQFDQQGQLVTSNTNSINNLNSGRAGMIQQKNADGIITVGKDSEGDNVSFANKSNKTRKISNVSAGDIYEGSSDVISGGQLYVEQVQRRRSLSGLARALGGNTSVAADGTITGPSYVLHDSNGTSHNVSSVGDALTNLDNRTVDNTNNIAANQAATNQQLSEQGSKIANNTSTINTNQTKTDQKFSDQGKQITSNTDAISSNKADTDNKLSDHEAKILKNTSAIDSNKSESDQKFSEQGDKIASNTSTIKTNKEIADNKFNEQSSEIASNTNAIKSNKEESDRKFDEQGNRITNNTNAISANKKEADQKFDAQGKLISSNTNAIEANKADADQKFSKQDQKISDNTDKINATQAGVDSQSKQISDNKADADQKFDTQGKLIVANKADADQKIETQGQQISSNTNKIDANKADTERKFDAQGALISNNTSKIEELSEREAPLSYDSQSKKVKLSSSSNQAESVDFHNGSGRAVSVKGVADGDISENSTDAVNGRQMYDTRKMISGQSERLDRVEDYVHDIDKRVRDGFAKSAALNGLFQPYGVGKFNVTAAAGGSGGHSALAIGSGYRFNENIAIKSGVAVSNSDDATYNLGINVEW